MSMRGRASLVALTLALLASPESPGFAQSFLAGTAQSANGVFVVVRTDGVETRLQGRRALQIFEGDILRIDGKGEALIETEEGIQVALTGNTVVKILSRWEKGKGMTRILRVQRGEVWVRNNDTQRAVEIETPVGILSARAAEMSVRLVSNNEAMATVVQDTADFSTPLSSCRLRAGTVSYGYRGKACTQPTVADIQSIISWSNPLLGH
jgi:hypothetical protein